jgi:hypothetical protein
MKDIRETQGRSRKQVEQNYKVTGIIWTASLILIITYSIINILT